jgi:hypothetical protein
MEMSTRHASTKYIALSTGVLLALSGCAATPMGPSVQVMPGPGKSFEAFRIDQADCKGFAYSQVQGQAEASNQRTAGTAVIGTVIGAGLGALVGSAYGNAGAGAAIGAGAGLAGGGSVAANNQAGDQMNIQQQYDNAFSQCMYSKGDQVPGYAPRPSYASGPASYSAAPDPLVRSTQSELIRLGFMNSGADGVSGPATRSAISRFEQSQGMPADGTPSSPLLARMQATPAGGAPSGASSGTPASASAPTNWVAPTTR